MTAMMIQKSLGLKRSHNSHQFAEARTPGTRPSNIKTTNRSSPAFTVMSHQQINRSADMKKVVDSPYQCIYADGKALSWGKLEKEPFHTPGRPESEAAQERRITFETPSKYDGFVLILLSIFLLSILFSFYKVYGDKDISEDEREKAYTTLIWTPISISIVFALVLPHSLQVRSDASLGVRTLFVTWWFSDVIEAAVNSPFAEHCRRPRYKFATSLFRDRVLVRRRRGRWDVLVSPRDTEAFIQAITSVSSELDDSSGIED